MKLEAKSVFDLEGRHVLYDLFVEDKWIGSVRTWEQMIRKGRELHGVKYKEYQLEDYLYDEYTGEVRYGVGTPSRPM